MPIRPTFAPGFAFRSACTWRKAMMSRPCQTCALMPGVTGFFGLPKPESIATTGTPAFLAWFSTGVVAFGSSG